MEYGFAFFPGQGAQHTGMGQALYEQSAAARGVFDQASAVAGFDVAALCFTSEATELNRTVNSQIAIFTHSLAALAALREAGVTFRAAAGFSLGEYTALTAAGVLSVEDGIRLVRRRGQLMQEAADAVDGCMAAILGLEDAVVEDACARAGGTVLPVNYNCPGQLVIAGEREAVDRAIALCKEAGARRALPLAVSGAFHTPMMAEAAAKLRAFAAELTVHPASMPVYSNLDGRPMDFSDLPAHLEQHMISPVRWKALIANGMEAGLTTGVEIGPGKTLCGFARKISRDLSVQAAETPEDIAALVGA